VPNNASRAKARSSPRIDGRPARERASVQHGRRGGGRPTLEESVRRDARLLDVATNLFMERGFDGTSIDAVAEAAGVSKPTVYARYHDKRDLFAAVLRGRIARWLAPVSAAAEAQANEDRPKGIRTTLHELSRQMVAQALMPECATLQRILAAQAVQFPELAERAYEEGWLRAIRGVANLLRQFAARDEIRVADPELAAELFLGLVLGHSKRLALYGMAADPKTEERHRHAGVELFLSGMGAR
jgi:TetR/AcrR family transcriptional regulator, mexJK operon transcriptional repressor